MSDQMPSAEGYNFTQFVEDASRTVSDGFYVKEKNEIDRLHAVIGISTEAAELVNAFTVEGACKNENNAAEEIGDALWYFSIIVRQFDLQKNWVMAPFASVATDGPDNFGAESNQTLLRHLVLHAADVLDYVAKKNTFYGKPFDLQVFLEKARPVVGHLTAIAERIGRTPEECMWAAIQKLKIRYPDKFTNALADNRDLDAEGKAIAGALK